MDGWMYRLCILYNYANMLSSKCKYWLDGLGVMGNFELFSKVHLMSGLELLYFISRKVNTIPTWCSNIKPSDLLLKEHWNKSTFHIFILIFLTPMLGPIFTHFLQTMEKTNWIQVTQAILWLRLICLFAYGCTTNLQK